MDLHPPDAVREIARRLEDAGYETWAVGGAVRDALLGLAPGDWDLATRARPRDVRRLFRRTVPIGVEHGTVGVLGRDRVLYEVTTFRRDVETTGRHAVVEFADSVVEDLARRDFTCNAIAWHPLRGELLDPFSGLDDLRAGWLRTVGTPSERFAEDYLRVLRALRFAGHFRLAIEPATWAALADATPHLTRLSAERVREELWKVLGKTWRASAALSLYAASGALRVLYPELDAAVGVRAPGARHDAWTESLLAVDTLPPARPLLRAAALLVAAARGAAAGDASTGDDEEGARVAAAVMRRLRASNADTERVARLVRAHGDAVPVEGGDPAVRRWLRRIGPDLLRDDVRLEAAFWRARFGAAPPLTAAPVGADPPARARAPAGAAAGFVAGVRRARAVLRSRPPLAVVDLAIGGSELRALGIAPGPRYGQILRDLLERVTDRPELNTREALLEIVRREFVV